MPVTKRIFTRTISYERFSTSVSTPIGQPIFCDQCLNSEPMFKIADVCSMVGISTRSILRACESFGVHFIESDDMEMLICLKSLNEFHKGVTK